MPEPLTYNITILAAAGLILAGSAGAQSPYLKAGRLCDQQVPHQDCAINIDLLHPHMPGPLTLLSGVGVVVNVFNERPIERCVLSHTRTADIGPAKDDAVTSVLKDLNAALSTAPLAPGALPVPGLTQVGRARDLPGMASELSILLSRAHTLMLTRFAFLGASVRTTAIDNSPLNDRSQFDRLRGVFVNESRTFLSQTSTVPIDTPAPLAEAVRESRTLLNNIVSSLQEPRSLDEELYIPANDNAAVGPRVRQDRYLICSDPVAQTTTLSEEIHIEWKNPENITVSVGMGMTTIVARTFKTQTTGQDQVLIFEDKTVPQVVPIVLVNFKLWTKVWWGRSINLGISPALAVNPRGIDAEFMIGPSINVSKVVFSIGPYFGRSSRLASGYALGTPVDIQPGTTPATVSDWREGVGISISYKLPVK